MQKYIPQLAEMSSLTQAVSLRISTIVHATEDSLKVDQAVRNTSQLNGSAKREVNRAKGHHGNQITTLVMIVNDPKTAESCLRDIWNRLTFFDKDTVLLSLASRVDTSGTLFLRVDKQEALKGTIRLQDSDPIKVAIYFKTFQSKQDSAVVDIRKFLTEIPARVAGSR